MRLWSAVAAAAEDHGRAIARDGAIVISRKGTGVGRIGEAVDVELGGGV